MEKGDITISVNGGPEVDFEHFQQTIDSNLSALKRRESTKILKAKVTKDNTLEVLVIETIVENEKYIYNEVFKKCGHIVHHDLTAAFGKLAIHCAIICEQIGRVAYDLDQVREDFAALLFTIDVTGFSIGGEDEHEGITLIGRKYLESGKVLNLIAPFTKWADEHNPYKYERELYEDYSSVEFEVAEYLNGKHAPSAQLQMEFEPKEETGVMASD